MMEATTFSSTTFSATSIPSQTTDKMVVTDKIESDCEMRSDCQNPTVTTEETPLYPDVDCNLRNNRLRSICVDGEDVSDGSYSSSSYDDSYDGSYGSDGGGIDDSDDGFRGIRKLDVGGDTEDSDSYDDYYVTANPITRR
jgi:hypothetical protein